MRKIKFRAWDIRNKCFIAFEDINISIDMNFKSDKSFCINIKNIIGLPEEVIVCQFTGLKDKSGKEIYEGDIVECEMSYKGGTLPHIGKIVWDDTFGAFATCNEAGNTLLHNHCLHTLKVIGNIYQNPELINNQKEK